jgi:hypothetical protein
MADLFGFIGGGGSGGGGGGGTLSSVGLSMPSAFSVTNSPLTANGVLNVIGAGSSSQYIDGTGALQTFPTNVGGGSAVIYYLNGSVNQGVIGGNTYYEMDKTAVFVPNADFSISADGYVAQFITDPNDPQLPFIPGGAWQFQLYFSASSSGGNPQYYIELYKYDGVSLSLISSNSAVPESITGGTTIDLYTTLIATPQTPLALTDRVAVRVYVIHSGRTITLHTQDVHICKVTTTFTYGLVSLNGLTDSVQYLQTGTSGTDFNINQTGLDTHVFNLPVASALNTGKLSNTDWSTFNNKQNALSFGNLTESTSSVLTLTGNLGAVIGGGTTIQVKQSSALQSGYLSSTDWNTFNSKQNALTFGVAGSVQFSSGTALTQDSTNFFWDNSNKRLGIGTNTPSVKLEVNNGNIKTNQAVIVDGSTPYGIRFNDNGFSRIVSGGLGSLKFDAYFNEGFAFNGASYQFFNYDQAGLTGDAFQIANSFIKGKLPGTLDPAKYFGINVSGTPTSMLHVVGTASSTDFGLKVQSSSGADNLVVRNDGNVGIGTGVPSASLDIFYGTTFTAPKDLLRVKQFFSNREVFKIYDFGGSGGSQITSEWASWGFGTTADLPSGNRISVKGVTSGSGTASIIVQDSSSNYTFILRDDGNVGIGTVAPTEKLSLVGNFSIGDGGNIIAGTTNGTKIGTSTSQKLGFFNATPIVQPLAVTTIQGVADALRDLGLLASSTITSYIGGTGTANEIAYFTGATTIGSLTTATYPSLTELSYVKGVTSAIQTQLNGKASTGAIGSSGLTMNTNRLLGRTTAGAGSVEEIQVTFTGTSGSATFSGGVLNIPNYSGAGYISSVWNVTTQTGASYSASNNDYVIINATAFQLTLPAISTAGVRVGVKMVNVPVGSNAIQVLATTATATIDGQVSNVAGAPTNLYIFNQWDAYTLVSYDDGGVFKWAIES